MNIRVIDFPECWSIPCSVSGTIDIPKDGRWQFNGDFERPTFSPSVNEVRGQAGQTHEEMYADPNVWRNHVFIRDGHIQYLSDCTHEMAGQTVEIVPIRQDLHGYYYPSGYLPNGMPTDE